tara:strand:+ start:966 stop:1643 length:678 start_codon:yes stop_codon:yes gene_type:complete
MVAPNFYNTVDQGIYNQGYSFIPQERFRGAFNPNTNIGFGSGITNTAAAAPFILPINQGGDGDGGGFTAAPDNSGFDYETDAYGLEDMSAADKGLTDEEQEALDNVNNPSMTKGQIAQIGFGMFTNPFGAILNAARIKKANEAKAIEAAREVATAQRAAENKAAGRGGYQSDFAQDSGFMDGPAGAGTGMGAADKGGSDSMGSFAYGGRVPYMMGGLANLVDIYD